MKKAELIGNLTEDVKVEKVKGKGGKECEVARITLACDGIAKDDTAFIRITVWEKQAVNLAKHCGTKGSKLYIEANIVPNNYEKDGVKHYGFDFTANRIEYLLKK